MTDPRQGDELLAAIRRLPAGSGVVFRHYQLAEKDRRKLFGRVRHVCRLRGHHLFFAGVERTAIKWGADGMHSRAAGATPNHSAPVHTAREIAKAKRNGARLLFLSPIFATRSHPGARALGATRFNQLARLSKPALVIALGGMSRARGMMLDKRMVHGWAAIDAFRT